MLSRTERPNVATKLRETSKSMRHIFLDEMFFMSAPTGSGKSFTFEIAPYAFDFLLSNLNTVVKDAGSVSLVVVPLVALMNDQVDSLRSCGLSAACVGSECGQETLRDICEAKYKLVFGTPEALLNNHRRIFHSPLKNRVRAIFIDESHCIAKW